MRGWPYPSRVLNSHYPGADILLLYPLAISPIKPGRGRKWLGVLANLEQPATFRPSPCPGAPSAMVPASMNSWSASFQPYCASTGPI